MSTWTAAFRARLAELDAEIVEQQVALKELERDRIAVHRRLHATSTFPVLTLPIEITAEIFSLCLPSIEDLREDYLPIGYRLSTQAPTLFLGVCRAWRDLALETSALWATVGLCFDSIAVDVASETVVEDFIHQWFGRAGLRPLSIVFSSISADSPFTPSRLGDLIHHYAHRLRHIELYISQHNIPELGLDSATFPLLQRAVLDDPFDPAPYFSTPVHIYNNAPRLHDLILLNGTHFSFYTPPSVQLTKFEGEITSDLNLFVLAPNLVEAKCVVNQLGTPPALHILHPRLQFLTLSKSVYSDNAPDDDGLDILPHLTLPALQSLHITDIGDFPQSISLFFTRSSPPLCTLSTTIGRGRFSEWDTCFSRVAATLENLQVYFPTPEFQNQVFHLGSEGSIYNPLPRLRTFHLTTTIQTDYTTLINFLLIRSATPTLAKIRSFRLVCRSGSCLRDNNLSGELGTGPGHLATLANTGIDIHIESMEKTFIKHVQYVPHDPAFNFS
ncbi:hypothetical protein B0H17DRAFT_1339597 [Mycena rosella]|uniref:F-box domain-containing protein n=1 Tax=Mycena rosella TaxID=1033263 RepID=A0AAD7C4F9_MYCRO|nr:hypothetical protein B0H17DRAFT_1339597 [Mycena rosella]